MLDVDVSGIDEGRLVIRQVESPDDPVLKGFAIELNGAEVQIVRESLATLLLDPNFPNHHAQVPNVTRLEHHATNWGASGELVELVIHAGLGLAIEEIGRRLLQLFKDQRQLVGRELTESTARFQVAVVYNVRAAELQLLESGYDSEKQSQSFRFRGKDGDEYYVEIVDDHGFPVTERHSHGRTRSIKGDTTRR